MNAGKWDHWYATGLDEPQPFGPDTTYQMGADWLSSCSLVEDWGCGKGWLRRFIPPDRYRGIDGSRTPFADKVIDLARYRSRVPGLFMRHVIEHDQRWRQILDNAVASFIERMVLVLFTPMVDKTHVMAYDPNPGVPDIAFAEPDITDRFRSAVWHSEWVATSTLYGVETVFYLERLHA